MSSRRNVLLFSLLFLLVPILPILKAYGAPATIAVDPPVSNVTIGDTFNINITVTNIVNFTCWELKLYFLNGVLNCTAAVEGPFLKTENGTYYGKTITNNFNVTHGQLVAYCTVNLITNITGSGTILTVTFKAVGGGNTPLHMADIKLGDEKIPPQPIPYTAVDGTVQVVSGVGHDVAITDVIPNKSVVGQGYGCNITVATENHGGFTETFDVTAYANTTIIASQAVTLTSGNFTTITFTWNTSGFAKGKYTISAYVWPVPGETDTSDNTFVNGAVKVAIVGDINGGGHVNILDAILLGNAFDSAPGEPAWSPNADLNGDGYVNILDAIILGNHFDEKES